MLLPIRSAPDAAGVPLVVVADDQHVAELARSLGARDCLVRTWIDLDALAECVRRNLTP